MVFKVKLIYEVIYGVTLLALVASIQSQNWRGLSDWKNLRSRDKCSGSKPFTCIAANGWCFGYGEYCDKITGKVFSCLSADEKKALEFCQHNNGNISAMPNSQCSQACNFRFNVTILVDNCTNVGLHFCLYAPGQCYRDDQYCDSDNHKIIECLAKDDEKALEFCHKNARNISAFPHPQCWSACHFRFKGTLFFEENCTISGLNFCLHANGQCYKDDQYCDKDNHKIQDCLAEDDEEALEFCHKNVRNISAFPHPQCSSACHFRFKEFNYSDKDTSNLIILLIMACSIGFVAVVSVCLWHFKKQIILKVASKFWDTWCLREALSLMNHQPRQAGNSISLKDKALQHYAYIDSSAEVLETEIVRLSPSENYYDNPVTGGAQILSARSQCHHAGNNRHVQMSARNQNNYRVKKLYQGGDRPLGSAQNQICHPVTALEDETEAKTCWQPNYLQATVQVHQTQRCQDRRKNKQADSNIKLQKKTGREVQYQDGFSARSGPPQPPPGPPPWKENQHALKQQTFSPPIYENIQATIHQSMDPSIQQKPCQPSDQLLMPLDKMCQTTETGICQPVQNCFMKMGQRTAPLMQQSTSALYEEDDCVDDEEIYDHKIVLNSWSSDPMSLSSEYHTAPSSISEQTKSNNDVLHPPPPASCPSIQRKQAVHTQRDKEVPNDGFQPTEISYELQYQKDLLSSATRPLLYEQTFYPPMDSTQNHKFYLPTGQDHKFYPKTDERKHIKGSKIHHRSQWSSNALQQPNNSSEPNRLSSYFQSGKMHKALQSGVPISLIKLSQMGRLHDHAENEYSKNYKRPPLQSDFDTQSPQPSRTFNGQRRKFALGQAPPDLYANCCIDSASESDSDWQEAADLDTCTSLAVQNGPEGKLSRIRPFLAN